MKFLSRKALLKNEKSGFTLVEIAIVLVVIGLLIGGVLVGRDLIAAAQIPIPVSIPTKRVNRIKATRINLHLQFLNSLDHLLLQWLPTTDLHYRYHLDTTPLESFQLFSFYPFFIPLTLTQGSRHQHLKTPLVCDH